MKSLMQKMTEVLKQHQDAERAAEVLIEQAYYKGFDNGVSHAKLGLVAETDQQKRDRIVKQAKEFVDFYKTNKVMLKYEFIVNRKKRTVVVLVRDKHSNRLFGKGIAKCAPNDCFNRHIGEYIALRRAIGLGVPQKYLDVPNPTDIRVGNVVKSNTIAFDQTPYKIVKLETDKAHDVEGCMYISCLDIIDDSESEPDA